MSIIYDALNKIEKFQTEDAKGKIDKKTELKRKVYLIYVLFVCLGFFITYIFFQFPLKPLLNKAAAVKNKPRLSKNDASISSLPQKPPEETLALKTIPAATVENKKEPQAASFVLNGVFFSENEGYALINNRILKEGDKIEGATVTRITLDEVRLEAEGSVIRLSK